MRDAPQLIEARTVQRMIGTLSLLLPFILVFGHIANTYPKIEILPTLSEYIYTPMQPFFIGILFSIGTMFFAYKGYTKNHSIIPFSDSSLSNIMSISAIGIAVFPTRSCLAPDANEILGIFHLLSAGILLLCMAIFCIFYFTQSPDPSMINPGRNRFYRICGYLIIAGLVMILAVGASSDKTCTGDIHSSPILWLEWMMMSIFSIAWLIKGKLLFRA